MKGLLSLLLRLSAIVGVTSCARGTSANPTPSPTMKPTILAEAHGRCPLHPAPGANLPLSCRRTRAGNGVTGEFVVPQRRPWGIAYSYACGKTPSSFYVVVGLPDLDGQMPETGFQRTGRAGRGYVIETGKANDTLHSLPTGYGAFQNIEIASACAWHVRAIVGTPAEVRARVPALPTP